MSIQAEQLGGERLGARGACAACGARPRRDDARYCATCGRALGQDYFPTESLRASYRFERQPAPEEKIDEAAERRRRVSWAEARPNARPAAAPRPTRAKILMQTKEKNGAATTALAFATYALVPYIGILFCPGALVAGGFGLLRSYRAPHMGGRRQAALGLGLGLLILCAQLLLWWILYKVPEWSRASSF
jgi:hypothetical protein